MPNDDPIEEMQSRQEEFERNLRRLMDAGEPLNILASDDVLDLAREFIIDMAALIEENPGESYLIGEFTIEVVSANLPHTTKGMVREMLSEETPAEIKLGV